MGIQMNTNKGQGGEIKTDQRPKVENGQLYSIVFIYN